MNELRATISEQIQQLHMFMHHLSFRGRGGRGGKHNPHMWQGRILSLLKMKGKKCEHHKWCKGRGGKAEHHSGHGHHREHSGHRYYN